MTGLVRKALLLSVCGLSRGCCFCGGTESRELELPGQRYLRGWKQWRDH